jgi:hypothetical protein
LLGNAKRSRLTRSPAISGRKSAPCPSQKTRNGQASTTPSLLPAVVEAARFWGGQFFVLYKIKLRR